MMRRVAGLATLGLLVCSLSRAQAPLLPTVKVVERAGTARNGDCADVTTVAMPALQVEPARPLEMPRAVEAAGVSATSIGKVLREVQQAAERDDREAFNDRLAQARTVASRLGPGPQKSAVAELLRVYGDLARVWDYSFASPTGAFFDHESQGGSLLSTLRTYPGYDDFISRRTVAGRYYPARETRQFLIGVTASRLKSVGGVPARAASRTPAKTRLSTPTAEIPHPGSAQSLRRERRSVSGETRSTLVERHPSRVVRRDPGGTVRGTSPAPRKKTAIAAPVLQRWSSASRSRSEVSPAVPIASDSSTPVSTSPLVATTSTREAPPITPIPAATTTLPADTTATTAVSDTTAAAATTSSASLTDTANTGAPPVAPSQRSVVIPLLMTIVGIVLLVVLIRASR
jgi:hypothetical protein